MNSLIPSKYIEQALVGKTVVSLAFGTDSQARKRIIGQKITKVHFGFNDCREDAGIILYYDGEDEDIDNFVYVYDNEEIEFT